MFWSRIASRARLQKSQWPSIPKTNHQTTRALLRRAPNHPRYQGYSTPSQNSNARNPTSRAERILSKLPPSMQRHTRKLRNAPVSHIVAFLILHEITAIVPLFGLFGLFHFTEYAPVDYMMRHYGSYMGDGVQRYERYFRRKGWFGFGDDDEEPTSSPPEPGKTREEKQEAVLQRWASSDAKYKIVVEVALAYAITKVLLPVRILASLWATPWFAGILVRVQTLARSRR